MCTQNQGLISKGTEAARLGLAGEPFQSSCCVRKEGQTPFQQGGDPAQSPSPAPAAPGDTRGSPGCCLLLPTPASPRRASNTGHIFPGQNEVFSVLSPSGRAPCTSEAAPHPAVCHGLCLAPKDGFNLQFSCSHQLAGGSSRRLEQLHLEGSLN